MNEIKRSLCSHQKHAVPHRKSAHPAFERQKLNYITKTRLIQSAKELKKRKHKKTERLRDMNTTPVPEKKKVRFADEFAAPVAFEVDEEVE